MFCVKATGLLGYCLIMRSMKNMNDTTAAFKAGERQESDRTSQNLSIANLLEYLPAHFFWRRLYEALFAR